MRIRHLGLLNIYQALSSQVGGYPVNVDGPTADAAQLNGKNLMLWLWRVASWRVTVTADFGLSYIPDGETTALGFTGSGSFELVIDSDGELFYEGLRKDNDDSDVEMNLLHRLRLEMSKNGGSGVGDFATFGFSFIFGAGITRYNGPAWVPTYKYTINGDNISMVNRDFDGSIDADGVFTVSFGTDPAFLTGTLTVEPETYYEYRDAVGDSPIWDAASGDQLQDPRIDTPETT